MRQRCTVSIEGIVQGVGFRPFVHRLATARGLSGRVWNDSRGVAIEVEGEDGDIEAMLAELRERPPPLARISDIRSDFSEPTGATGFLIDQSKASASREPQIAPDTATCEECVGELFDPADRRFHYPFLNCTHCGPRLTIIRDVPYDRPLTSMAGFEMCAECRSEYEDPSDRRFHAQPTACPDCGPRLTARRTDWEEVSKDSIAIAVAALRDGRIVAVKGLGGYHLACDAEDEQAVARLRRRKQREAKPFALMVADIDQARALCMVAGAEEEALLSRRRPIVLLRRRGSDAVAGSVAPGQATLGLMLPYTPLHHLLLRTFDRPLVMTSANFSDEPIVSDDSDARERLPKVADLLLVHDRPIETRTDDSVVRIICGRDVPMRRARGFAPEPVRLPIRSERPILALGGDLKACFALARGDKAFLSHHIGDLADLATYSDFTRAVAHYQRLFGVTPEIVAHDLHPGYLSSRFAAELESVKLLPIQHHHAHVAACMADNGVSGSVIGVAFDGTGYGTDGAIWGGEFLIVDYLGFERAGHLRNVPLPGGDAAVRQPWRAALAHLASSGALESAHALFAKRIDAHALRLVTQMVERNVGCAPTSSVGRLFDAVAAMLGLVDEALFEAQAAMLLEATADESEHGFYPVAIESSDDGLIWNPSEMFAAILEDRRRGDHVAMISARFHNSVAEAIRAMCGAIRARSKLERVALSGGVFQNRFLTERTVAKLHEDRFEVLMHHQVPANDGGLCLGQAAIACAVSGEI